MATAVKQFYHSLDLGGVNQLLNSRLHTVTDAEETTLAGTLGAANEGLVIYNSDSDTIKTWDGTQFNSVAPAVAGDVIFQGIVTDLSAGGTPATTVAGSQYIAGADGTLAWTGVTFTPNADVTSGDVILFTSPTTASVLQRNDAIATETTAGNVLLATAAEVIAGTVTDEAVTPATLAAWAANLQLPKTFFATVNLADGVATTINHNLGLQDLDAFVINTMVGNSQVSVDVDAVDANNLTLTACPAITGLAVTVIGY